MSLGFLDLFGILLIGIIAAIATSAVQGRPIPNVVSNFIEFTNMGSLTPQIQAMLLGLGATSALLLKSLISYYITFRNANFLSTREARLASNMAAKIFNQPITNLQKFSTSEYQHSLTTGVNSAMVGILVGGIAFLSEIFLQIIMGFTLFIFSPTLFIIFILYFGSLFFILNRSLGYKAKSLSKSITDISIRSLSAIADSLGSYREIVVGGKQDYFINLFSRAKHEIGQFSVKNSMLGQFSKYVFENSVVLGGAIFASYAFFTKSAIEAASLLAVFIVASSRLVPSLLKIQLGLLLLKGNIGASIKFFEILGHIDLTSRKSITDNGSLDLSQPVISFTNVKFRYPETELEALSEITCEFAKSKFTAVVGPSGSGKSTLIDLMLGVLDPQEGEISVFGLDPRLVPRSSLSVGYVPQRVYLSAGSIIENVCFGESKAEWDEEKVWKVLSQVLLHDWVSELSGGLYNLIGEGGARLSGGQRQRLGIARALYTNPQLLVLDEATSALDAISEYEITEAFERLDKGLTKVVIAHRLSTVLKADKIVYLKGGKIQGMGTFNELRELIPDFDRQAELMGISK